MYPLFLGMTFYLVDQNTNAMYADFGEVIFIGASFKSDSSDIVLHFYSLDEMREPYRRIPLTAASQKLHPTGNFSRLSLVDVNQKFYSDLRVIKLVPSTESSNLPNVQNVRRRSAKEVEDRVPTSVASDPHAPSKVPINAGASDEVKRLKTHLDERTKRLELQGIKLTETIDAAKVLESELKASKKENTRVAKEVKVLKSEVSSVQEKLKASQQAFAAQKSQISIGTKAYVTQGKEMKALETQLRVSSPPFLSKNILFNNLGLEF